MRVFGALLSGLGLGEIRSFALSKRPQQMPADIQAREEPADPKHNPHGDGYWLRSSHGRAAWRKNPRETRLSNAALAVCAGRDKEHMHANNTPAAKFK
jgi:hypothetical protein